MKSFFITFFCINLLGLIFLLTPVKAARVVYGSRMKKQPHRRVKKSSKVEQHHNEKKIYPSHIPPKVFVDSKKPFKVYEKKKKTCDTIGIEICRNKTIRKKCKDTCKCGNTSMPSKVCMDSTKPFKVHEKKILTCDTIGIEMCRNKTIRKKCKDTCKYGNTSITTSVPRNHVTSEPTLSPLLVPNAFNESSSKPLFEASRQDHMKSLIEAPTTMASTTSPATKRSSVSPIKL